jgi:hypothetical protein
MSANVAPRSAVERRIGATRGRTPSRCRAGSCAALKGARLTSIGRHQHIALSEQQAAARGAVTFDLATSHPSVDGANLYATQLRNFALRQKLFALGAVVPHARLLESILPGEVPGTDRRHYHRHRGLY